MLDTRFFRIFFVVAVVLGISYSGSKCISRKDVWFAFGRGIFVLMGKLLYKKVY